MFDFQKLEVYRKAKAFNKDVYSLREKNSFDRIVNARLSRAAFSIMFNNADGSSCLRDRNHLCFPITNLWYIPVFSLLADRLISYLYDL